MRSASAINLRERIFSRNAQPLLWCKIPYTLHFTVEFAEVQLKGQPQLSLISLSKDPEEATWRHCRRWQRGSSRRGNDEDNVVVRKNNWTIYFWSFSIVPMKLLNDKYWLKVDIIFLTFITKKLTRWLRKWQYCITPFSTQIMGGDCWVLFILHCRHIFLRRYIYSYRYIHHQLG